MDNPENPPFPVSRFIYFGDFRYYYPYGNTPAEDFLENITDEVEPVILLLGCGDIRSCFYTLWKNFSPEYNGRFSGVQFVLNDYCAAVLARNILFLYLCFQVPDGREEIRKWIAALWDIWFCHELQPEHKHVLNDALSQLLSWSENLQVWSESTDNPLCKIVRFVSEATLHDIKKVWIMWFKEKVQVGTVHAMRAARKEVLEERHAALGGLENAVVSAVIGYLGLLSQHISSPKRHTMKQEVTSYYHSGNAYAESVLHLPLSSCPKSVNLTLFDRANGKYTMHYASVPYNSFFHAFQFSQKELEKAGIAMLVQPVVEDDAYVKHPLLANSVQQFTLWLVASANVLLNASKDQPKISFTFKCSDAVTFCQQVQQHPHLHAACLGFEPKFDLIYSSNLLDHVAPPNLVLTALPLLKENGLLFTCALLYKDVAPNSEKYLETCFGFESKLLPIICGTRCIGNDGEYASPISLQPVPFGLGNILMCKQWPKLLIWKRMSALPLRVTNLNEESDIVRTLGNSISVMLTSFFDSQDGLMTTTHLCSKTAVAIVLSFASTLDSDTDLSNYHFWSHLCSHLQRIGHLKPFLVQLQTLSHLHGLHLHLTVSESDCPLCNMTMSYDQFCVELSLIQPAITPAFVICIHKSTNVASQMEGVMITALTTGSVLQALSGLENIHLIDGVAGREVGDKLKLDFFAPHRFTTYGYRMTVLCYETRIGHGLPSVNAPTVLIQGQLVDYRVSEVSYAFKQLEPQLSTSKSLFGKLTRHSGSSSQFETLVSISDVVLAALESSSLNTKSISDSEFEIFCKQHSIQLSYPYPVDYQRIKVKLSRRNRTISVVAPRDVYHFHKEKPIFVANPDNGVTLPPMLLSLARYVSCCGMQFTNKDRQIQEKCNREHRLMPALVNLKETMNFLFQCMQEIYFEFRSSPSAPVLGIVVVHHRVFDLQRNTPAVDLSFCFLQAQSREQVVRKWKKIIPPAGTRSILVDEAEYDILHKVFNFFASRTAAVTARKSLGHNPHLAGRQIARYFTRAVVYPLYPDPDLSIQEMGIDKFFKTPVSEWPAPSPLLDPHQHLHSTTPTVKTASTSVGIDNKCSFCDVSSSSSNDLKKCGGCGKAQYCGKECQKQHWKVHKAFCQSSKGNNRLKAPVMATAVPLISRCNSCGREASSLKICRCHLVAYCGIECQRNNWPKHRGNCIPDVLDKTPEVSKTKQSNEGTDCLKTTERAPVLRTVVELSKCNSCGREAGLLRKCRCHLVAYCGTECQRNDWLKHQANCTAKISPKK